MTEAKRRSDWDQTASILLAIARACGNTDVELHDFHPMRQKPRSRFSVADWVKFNAPLELHQKRAAEAAKNESGT